MNNIEAVERAISELHDRICVVRGEIEDFGAQNGMNDIKVRTIIQKALESFRRREVFYNP